MPEPIHEVVEPAVGHRYLLYVPSTYDASKSWPLIMVCHGTPPWDTAWRQILDWVKLAEEKQFIVAAPLLEGTRGDFPPPADQQITLQRDDERRIIATVRHVRGAYTISTDQIFLAGWSAGGYAVLYTGLRHPEIFRALAVLQGNFDSAYLSEVGDAIDPHQPILVLYGSEDVLTGEHADRCAKWLIEHEAYVTKQMTGGPHRGHPTEAYDFFERAVRRTQWLHIKAFSTASGDPFEVRFDVRSSVEPRRYHWSFGDGATSPVAGPVHRYAAAGTYTVTLTAHPPDGDPVVRQVEVAVPQLRATPPPQ